MAKSEEFWASIRAEYEAGATCYSLAKKYGVTHTGITKKLRQQNWQRKSYKDTNIEAYARAEQLALGNDQETLQACDPITDSRARVIHEQRQAWEGYAGKILDALDRQDFNLLKCLKISSEALRNVQECQRRAWGIVDSSVLETTGVLELKWQQ